MSILAKTLAAPLVGLCLYTGFVVYSAIGYREANDALAAIAEQYPPASRLAAENLRLFVQSRAVFAEALIAGEQEWIARAVELERRQDLAFEQLAGYPLLVDADALLRLRAAVRHYHDNARLLALAILADGDGSDQRLVQQVEISYTDSQAGLEQLQRGIGERFLAEVGVATNRLNHLLLLSGLVTVLLLLVVAAVSVMLSVRNRASLRGVIGGMKSLAGAEADFSARLSTGRRDEFGALVHGFNDLAESLERDYRAMEKTAITDKLTGLNNRARSDAYLSGMLGEGGRRPLSVILFDLDHFKTINDRFGHVAGDEVLVHLAGRLRAWARSGEFIARWGGEEFIVILAGVDEGEAATRAELLRLAIAHQPFPNVGPLTASFGVTGTVDGEDAVEVMTRVDARLYFAKRRGRNRVVAADEPAPSPESDDMAAASARRKA